MYNLLMMIKLKCTTSYDFAKLHVILFVSEKGMQKKGMGKTDLIQNQIFQEKHFEKRNCIA